MFDDELVSVNQQLKQEGVRLKIRRRGNTLFLVGTLPPKPSSTKTKRHQQEITLQLKAEPLNLREAADRARFIHQSLKLNKFNWEEYSPKVYRQEHKTIGDLLIELSEERWQKLEKTPERELSWKHQVLNYLQKLPLNDPPTLEVFKQFLASYPETSRTRERLAWAVASLARLADFSSRDIQTLKNLRGKYSITETAPRRVLSDEDLLNLRVQVEPGPARWVIEALTLWGLRPHELYSIQSMDKEGIIEVYSSKTKTTRLVLPLYKEWFQRWGTAQGKPPETSRKRKGQAITALFADLDLNLQAYDLRHSWAVRTLFLPNFKIETAARMMGHSVSVHERTYHHWLSKVHARQKYSSIFNQEQRDDPWNLPDPPEPKVYKQRKFYGPPSQDTTYKKQPCPFCGSTRIQWQSWDKDKAGKVKARRQKCTACGRTTAISADSTAPRRTDKSTPHSPGSGG